MARHRRDYSNIEKKKINRDGLRKAFQLYKYIKPHRWEYAIGMFFLLGSSLANLAFPKLIGDLVNAGNEGSLLAEMNKIIILIIIVLVVQSVFSYFRIVLFVNVTEKTLALLRQHTYSHLIRLPIRFFDKRRVGELNSRISSDISLLQETLTSTLAEFIRQIIIIIGGITLLMITSFKLTLFMLAVLPPMILLAVFFGRYIRKFSKDVQSEVANSNTIVEETLQGIRIVKTFTNEFFETLRYKKKTEEIAVIGMKSGKYRGAFSAFMILGMFGAMVAVIWRGSVLLSEGTINTGELFSFVIYSGFIGGTIGGLANVYTRIQKFIGATEDLFEIFKEEEEELHPIEKLKSNEIISGSLHFDGISFAYPSRPDEIVIHDLDLKINANQKIALVGASGAGKSTLGVLSLLLYEPNKGNLLFDGRNSKEFTLSSLRSQIALVPQDIFLFGGTIRENIVYGKPNSTEEEIIEAAKKANAWEFIERFPDQLETIVGERGTQLSGGQRQRIAIARAILKNPKILILDEATSSLDSESERLVQEALEYLMTGRTSIVIAHRLSTVRNSDRIIVLEHGRIVEEGRHEELMKISDGVYKNLSELQFSR